MDEMRKVKVSIPAWTAVLYVIISLGLIPWTVYLGSALPNHHISPNWDITWVGLDIGLIVSLLATGILAWLKSIYMVFAAVITGTLLITDAWFDILSYRAGSHGFTEAVVTALIGEIPVAIMSFTLAIRGLKKLHTSS